MPKRSLTGLKRHPAFGFALATFGALMLTPDALFLRWSGMDGLQMLGWRGLCMGGLFVLAWAVTSRSRRADLGALMTGAGAVIVVTQFFNALLFPVGIANAPVAVMLLGVATAPVWAALLAGLILRQHTPRATWIAIAFVMLGIGIAVSGKGDLAVNPNALTGALCGLGVAFALALNFTMLRKAPNVPLLLAIGIGAMIAGMTGWLATGPAQMTRGTLWAILVTGLLILPVSFFALSVAARHTEAANVSLLMLLETVLGPVWVWLGTDEVPTARMAAGGAVVVVTLALYLSRQIRR